MRHFTLVQTAAVALAWGVLTPLEAAGCSRFLTEALELKFRKVITRPALTDLVAPSLTMVQSDGRFFKGRPAARKSAPLPPLTAAPVE